MAGFPVHKLKMGILFPAKPVGLAQTYLPRFFSLGDVPMKSLSVEAGNGKDETPEVQPKMLHARKSPQVAVLVLIQTATGTRDLDHNNQ